MDKQQQPVAIGIPVGQHNAPAVAADGEFSTDLCDCFSDVSLCCLTCWCPCITFGRIAEIVDRGSTSCGMSGVLYTLLAFTGFQCIYSGLYRQKMKARYGIPEECPADFCLNCWCEYCALCQGYRELQHRGYDVTLGWHGNMERQNKDYQGVATGHGGASIDARWYDPIGWLRLEINNTVDRTSKRFINGGVECIYP